MGIGVSGEDGRKEREVGKGGMGEGRKAGGKGTS